MWHLKSVSIFEASVEVAAATPFPPVHAQSKGTCFNMAPDWDFFESTWKSKTLAWFCLRARSLSFSGEYFQQNWAWRDSVERLPHFLVMTPISSISALHSVCVRPASSLFVSLSFSLSLSLLHTHTHTHTALLGYLVIVVDWADSICRFTLTSACTDTSTRLRPTPHYAPQCVCYLLLRIFSASYSHSLNCIF